MGGGTGSEEFEKAFEGFEPPTEEEYVERVQAEVEKRRSAATYWIQHEILQEIVRQNAKWGAGRHMPSFTEQYWGPLMPSALEAQALVEEATEYEELSWEDLLFEELCEAHAEKEDPSALCKELIQSAAVIVQWIADLRRP